MTRLAQIASSIAHKQTTKMVCVINNTFMIIHFLQVQFLNGTVTII